jgi:hypothetical protein
MLSYSLTGLLTVQNHRIFIVLEKNKHFFYRLPQSRTKKGEPQKNSFSTFSNETKTSCLFLNDMDFYPFLIFSFHY